MNKKKKILLVEDEAIAVMTMEDIFEEWGYELCCVASNGIDALKCAKESQPDVIVMDINLQGKMDGVALAEKLKEITDATIIFITGYSILDYEDKIATVSPRAFLEKPIDFEKMRACIEGVGLI